MSKLGSAVALLHELRGSIESGDGDSSDDDASVDAAQRAVRRRAR